MVSILVFFPSLRVRCLRHVSNTRMDPLTCNFNQFCGNCYTEQLHKRQADQSCFCVPIESSLLCTQIVELKGFTHHFNLICLLLLFHCFYSFIFVGVCNGKILAYRVSIEWITTALPLPCQNRREWNFSEMKTKDTYE